MAEEVYTKKLYNYVSSLDPTYGKDVPLDSFELKMKDKKYATDMYQYISSVDPTYSKDVPLEQFFTKVNPPKNENLFQKAWSGISNVASTVGNTISQAATNMQSGYGLAGPTAAELARDTEDRKNIQKRAQTPSEVDVLKKKFEEKNTEPTKFGEDTKDLLPEQLIKASILGSDLNATVNTAPNSKSGEPDVIKVTPYGDDALNNAQVNKIYNQSLDLLGQLGYAKQDDGSFKRVGQPTISPEDYEAQISVLKKNIQTTANRVIDKDAILQKEKNISESIKKYGSSEGAIIGLLFGKGNSEEAIKMSKDLLKIDAELTASVQSLKANQITAPIQEAQSKAFLQQDYINPDKTVNFGAWNQGIDESIKNANSTTRFILNPQAKSQVQQTGIDLTYAGDPKNKALVTQKFNYKDPEKSLAGFTANVVKAQDNLSTSSNALVRATSPITGFLGGAVDFFTGGQMSALDQDALYLGGVLPYKQQYDATVSQLKDQIKANDEEISKIIEAQANVQPGYTISPEGKKQLQDLQATNLHLNKALEANQETVNAINKSIVDNTKNLTAQQATVQWLEDKYNSKGRIGQAGEATGYFVRGVMQLPGSTGSLVKKLSNLAVGDDFKSTSVVGEENPIYDYTPQELTQSISDAIKYDPENGISYDGVGLWFSILKTGAESLILGGGGLLAEGAGAAIIGKTSGKSLIKAELAGLTSAEGLGEAALQKAYQGWNYTKYGLEYGTKEGAKWLIDAGIGYVAPSVLMFGNEMIDNELKKGLSLSEATEVGVIRAAIEGLTEKLNPLEMNILKGRIALGEVRNLGDDIMFKELMRSKLGMSSRAFDFLYGSAKVATKSLKQGGYETLEEEIGLWLNDLKTKSIQTDHPEYVNDEPFNRENVINTALVTMATMLPMSAKSGFTEGRHDMKSLQYSRYVVGANPQLYMANLSQRYAEGALTEKQALKNIQLVNNLADAYEQAKPQLERIGQSVTMTGAQRKEAMTEVFNNHLKLNDMATKLETLKPEVAAAKLDELVEIQEANDAILEKAERRKQFVKQYVPGYDENAYFNIKDEQQVVDALNSNYEVGRIQRTTDVKALETNITHVNEQLDEINSIDESRQPFDIKTKLETVKNNLEMRLLAIQEGKDTRVVRDQFIKIESLNKPEAGITQEEVDKIDQVPQEVLTKMAELQDLVPDGFTIFSKNGKYGVSNPESQVLYTANTVQELDDYLKSIDLKPKSTGELAQEEAEKVIAEENTTKEEQVEPEETITDEDVVAPEGIRLKVTSRISGIWNSDTNTFEFYNSKGARLTNTSQIIRYSRKLSTMPNVINIWWNEFLSQEEKKNVIADMTHLLELYKKGTAADVEFLTPTAILMESLRGTKFKPAQLKGELVDVDPKKWLSSKGEDLDLFVKNHLLPILEENGVVVDEQDAINLVIDAINNYPRGITKLDVQEELRNNNPAREVLALQDAFAEKYGLDIDETLSKLKDEIEKFTEDNLQEQSQGSEDNKDTRKSSEGTQGVLDLVYREATETTVTEDNEDQVNTIGGTGLRSDKGIVYLGDKLVYVSNLAAYEARDYQEVEDGAASWIENTNNLLNPIYAQLHSNTILPGKPLIIKVKSIGQSRFVKESKARFKDGIDERFRRSGISTEAQLEDLNNDDNFREIEVYDTEGNFLFNLHTLAYVRHSRVAAEVEEIDNNIAVQYDALKDFRQAIINMHTDLESKGLSTDISTKIAGKGTGKLSVDLEKEFTLIGEQFSNPDVLASINVASGADYLSYDGKQSINVQPAGSIGVLIPTPNGEHFALQLTPLKLNQPTIESITSAIKLTVEYRGLVSLANKSQTQISKMKALETVLNQVHESTGFDLFSLTGLKEYLAAITNVNGQTSQFLEGSNREALANIPFIDFDADQEKITFSRGRNFEVKLEEGEAVSTKDYEKMGVYRINFFTKERGVNPGLDDFLTKFGAYLKDRRFNFDKNKQDKTASFNLPVLKKVGDIYQVMSDAEMTQKGIAAKYRNYKDFMRANVSTNVLEHKIEVEGKTEYVYFEQPNISVSHQIKPVAKEVQPMVDPETVARQQEEEKPVEETKTTETTETTDKTLKSGKKSLDLQDEEIDEDFAPLGSIVRDQQLPIDHPIEFGDLTSQIKNICK